MIQDVGGMIQDVGGMIQDVGSMIQDVGGMIQDVCAIILLGCTNICRCINNSEHRFVLKSDLSSGMVLQTARLNACAEAERFVFHN